MPSNAMRLVRVLSLLLATGGLAIAPGCSCSDPSTGSGKPCRVDSECPDGETCIDGKCTVEDDDDAGLPPGCVDADGDRVCSFEDCNDADPTQTGTETCDGADNDCDGTVDEGVLNTCGNCEPGCMGSGLGPSEGGMFDLDMDENDGVGLDDEDGALILDSQAVNTDVIWIANTGAGQVVKVDTDTYEELGRYWTDVDPSRTTVNTAGDVYVGNRDGYSVTKVSVLGEDCPDTNGDGTITTSMGGGHIVGSGPSERFQDDCVLWHTELPPEHGIIRAMAAQDVEGADGELVPYVWAGGWGNRLYKIDGETGEVLINTDSPVATYGFALDAAGRLWISGINGGLGVVDTTRCVDDTTCAVDICNASDAESDECDGAVKAEIPVPGSGYGITVDFQQRVWLGGWSGTSIKRYDPSAASGSRWAHVDPPEVGRCNGVAADAEGFAYAACEDGNLMVRVDGDTLDYRVMSTDNNRGIAVDADGKIWGINRHGDSGAANVLDPGPTLADTPSGCDPAAGLECRVAPTLQSPYTYSDMTGLQLRLATNPRGYYRHLFEGCAEGATTSWTDLTWDAETPAGTSVIFRVKTADTRDALDAMDWVTVAQQPPDAPPASIESALMDAGVTPGRLLMLEVILQAERMSTTEVITPRVLGMNVQHICPPEFG